ncbi:DUF421 domain-containing protein [Alteribacter natronophilus]|uniref:DUF421 domain-containing protein n=1 Tax=Alteribacter natronophilus TaxID=2583810 RepID=UPI00110E5354|nr:DUF421 domain-containing protein [Alteribacter natronophilus]TMW73658.1 DUF421 domain-containing protein [Alteribacter natronophilus]
MNTTFPSLTIELLAGFFALLILTKVLGKTQITQLTPFDFISALVLGELVGNAIYDKEIGLNYVLYAVVFWGGLIFTVEFITQKWKRTRGILEGKPSIVIRDGVIDREELRKSKLDLNQLQHLLRDKDVFSMEEVAYAVLEPNGTVNVMKKGPYQAAVRQDLKPGEKKQDTLLPISIISDGEWVSENVGQIPFSKEDIEQTLAGNGIPVRDILYGEYTEGKPLYIQINHFPYVKKIELSSGGSRNSPP